MVEQQLSGGSRWSRWRSSGDRRNTRRVAGVSPVPNTVGRGAAVEPLAAPDARAGTVPNADSSVPPSVKAAASWSWRLLLIGGLVVSTVWIGTMLKVILVPIAVALLVTVLLTPVQRFLIRRLRLGRGLASGLSVLALVAFVVGLVAVAGRSSVSGIKDLSQQASTGLSTFTDWLSDGPLHLDSDTVSSWIDTGMQSLRDNQSQLVSGAIGAASTVGHFLAGALIALFCTFFFLLDGRAIWAWLVGLLPTTARDRTHQAGRRGLVTLGAYARTQILVALIDSAGIGIGAALLGVPLAFQLGILVFIGSFIPIVGALVTGAMAVLVALVANGWVSALIMLAVVILVQQIEGHFLQPFLMGHAVSLHPVAVLLVVAAGSFAAGIIGALFAVPLAATINTVVLYFHGHDKFPELGTGDRIVIRGREVPPEIRAAEQVVSEDPASGQDHAR